MIPSRYRCIFNDPPPKDSVPTCSQVGVLGPIAGFLGTLQAVEAIKYLINAGSLLINKILVVNGLDMDMKTINLQHNKDCPVCGEHPSITGLN